MCERCHSEIFELYKESVHGGALLGEGNADVPSCTDCHQRPQDPGTAGGHGKQLFPPLLPELCRKCHSDAALMGKYGLNADVYDTYVADFHGTTVTLFEKLAPGQETNKPVCIDCHGVHDMRMVDDPGEYSDQGEPAGNLPEMPPGRHGQLSHLLDRPLPARAQAHALGLLCQPLLLDL